MILVRLMLLVCCLVISAAAVFAQTPGGETQKIGIGYLRVNGEEILPLSRIDTPPDNDGEAGAQLGIRDNQTTGRFTKQDFTLTEEKAASEEEALAALDRLLAANIRLIVVDAPAAALLKLADSARAKDVLLFNVTATDDGLRAENCRANLFHIAPSRAMLADALAQYLACLLYTSPSPRD